MGKVRMFSGTSIKVFGFSRTGDITLSSSVDSLMNSPAVVMLGVSSGSSLGELVFFSSSSLSCEYGLQRRGFREKAKGRKISSCFWCGGSAELGLLSSVFFSSPMGEVWVSLNTRAKSFLLDAPCMLWTVSLSTRIASRDSLGDGGGGAKSEAWYLGGLDGGFSIWRRLRGANRTLLGIGSLVSPPRAGTDKPLLVTSFAVGKSYSWLGPRPR
mmetsp:Transcript_19114/g.47253  ORF Transcript_19114/g.47253 Transcript_19114/m.47253 type:complete len:213 (-) Transcript_19114:1240-1878(-)